MTLPLPGGVEYPKSLPEGGHAGLWFDKFCNQWRVEKGRLWSMTSGRDGENPKLAWIDTLTGSRVGGRGRIEESAARLIELVDRRDGTWLVLRTSSRFVTGLGRSHPAENGFAWHPTLGIPYLPGSSIKGMVRAWAKREAGAEDAAVDRLFGDGTGAGCVSFLDALPVEPVQVEADVMTPHYAGWTEDDPPGDWRSPTPIPFLVTARGTRFLFGVVPAWSAADCDLDSVVSWLTEAVQWAGGGAKTAVGYGRFDRDEPSEAQLRELAGRRRQERSEAVERERRLAALPPVEREIEDVLARRPDRNVPETTAIFQAIQSGRWTGEEKLQAARWLKTRMQKEKRWKPTSTKKNKDHARTLGVRAWLEEAE